MMFLRKLFDYKSRLKNSIPLFNITSLFCGIGDASIEENSIIIENYPFEPSAIFPNKILEIDDIEAISLTSYPLLIKLANENEVVFVSREMYDELKDFVKKNEIKTFKETQNWDWILEPYLDTEYTSKTDKRIKKLLSDNGIDNVKLKKIRNEVGNQMYKYNFDTMLWDWVNLGLSDVLAAMRAKYNKDKFHNFFKRAMEIELKGL